MGMGNMQCSWCRGAGLLRAVYIKPCHRGTTRVHLRGTDYKGVQHEELGDVMGELTDMGLDNNNRPIYQEPCIALAHACGVQMLGQCKAAGVWGGRGGKIVYFFVGCQQIARLLGVGCASGCVHTAK